MMDPGNTLRAGKHPAWDLRCLKMNRVIKLPAGAASLRTKYREAHRQLIFKPTLVLAIVILVTGMR